jgi:hypothetical protein
MRTSIKITSGRVRWASASTPLLASPPCACLSISQPMRRRAGHEQIIEGTEPMGDLGELLIDDLTEGDEDQVFGILEDL